MDAYSWAILTALIWGFVPILEKVGLSNIHPALGVFFRSLGVVIGIFIFGFFLVKPAQLRTVDIKAVAFLVTGGFLASFLAQMTFYNALKLGDVSKVVPISASYPLITFILGILIFKEGFSVVKCLGAAAVIIGIWAIKVG
ncbi:MAG TPA: EamA family transporter [Candidatus Omnitrophota bacterium]|nr:EamA family transporter [Candidatus Omnitrophota bacterium]